MELSERKRTQNPKSALLNLRNMAVNMELVQKDVNAELKVKIDQINSLGDEIAAFFHYVYRPENGDDKSLKIICNNYRLMLMGTWLEQR